MLYKLFLLFLVVPIIEIYLMIKVGNLIGGVPTVAILLLISFLGAHLVRSQGFRIITQVREELAKGRLPAAQMLDGALVLVGSILLLVPGFCTDFLGIFFLVPVTRRFIKLWIGLWLQARLSRGRFITRRRF
jgi:UPF0716 protein FxsA